MLSLRDFSYDFLITKELIFGFQILDLKVHFSASLIVVEQTNEKKCDLEWIKLKNGTLSGQKI